MNRLNLTTVVVILVTIAACKKNVTADKIALAAKTSHAVEECQPVMYNLVVDSASGFSYIFKVAGSPGAGPISVTPYVVSGTNQLKDCSGNPILRASGLSYDPATGVFWGTTGATGSVPNAILKFIDPNCVTIVSLPNPCGLVLDVSDIERDQTSGVFYAINRGTVAPNNRIVKLGVAGSFAANCLPNPLPVGLRARGLTFNCNGQLYVMHTSGSSGTIVFVDKVTGLNGATYPYPGPITSSASVPVPELGLHFDCGCIGRFITGSFNPTGAPLMTDGMPSGLGTPVYNAVLGGLKPTVDFARP
ncbi:hypothetical protein A4D02_30745 [Niastella koreensis]|uniref:Lipoprotein n=2 Tax=Niastella koreensis TaxID=354356 RepID=G8THQ0_NIAKG|nr:hypothetical protein [Niastella koreensis]AEV97478.1 hypothetical protein Niako_1102 [Niastella koreensis GR20-10]OQP47703.1 hypothetical protein A4D02_30745 [Niastella koreensis]